MRKEISKLLERVEVFNDSAYMANQLRMMADEAEEANESGYNLRESAENIDGMFELLCDIRKELAIKETGL